MLWEVPAGAEEEAEEAVGDRRSEVNAAQEDAMRETNRTLLQHTL